ncbi:MAG: hypothetical protein V1754_11085 [Pseudomonadota bacterium]
MSSKTASILFCLAVAISSVMSGCNKGQFGINDGAPTDVFVPGQRDGSSGYPDGFVPPGKTVGGEGKAFPTDQNQDPGVKVADGVSLDSNGDLTLGKTSVDFNFMWIANTDDDYRGTISKIDTVAMKEVARYYTITCNSNGLSSDCLDLHGRPIQPDYQNRPSRTAVDYNFDVWVANRAFNGQPSVTKIANDRSDCIDRNKNGKIDTSSDLNGDGKIDLTSAEFVGEDDECVLFTINYGDQGNTGRSVCLDEGVAGRSSDAWVGTYHRAVNVFYRIDGTTGKLFGPYSLVGGHHVYGCVVDSYGILWSTDWDEGRLAYLNTKNPTQVGTPMQTPWYTPHLYGITLDAQGWIWVGGLDSQGVYRYAPNRTSFSTLGKGEWTRVVYPQSLGQSRGIAADDRGKVWVATHTSGGSNIFRTEQSVGPGVQDQSASNNYWPVTGTETIGVGVDFSGNVWAVSYYANMASRLDVDSTGDPILPATGQTNTVRVGEHPYTYSDFTGFGLKTFTRPQGRYTYQLSCENSELATWKKVSWKTTTPPNTSVTVQVRSGDSETSFGQWIGPSDTSPWTLNTLVPNPSMLLQIEFLLERKDTTDTPVLHDFTVEYSCSSPVR